MIVPIVGLVLVAGVVLGMRLLSDRFESFDDFLNGPSRPLE